MPNGKHPICKEWKDLNLRVELEKAGGNYSWMVEAPRTEVPYGHAWPRIAKGLFACTLEGDGLRGDAEVI